MGFSVEFMNNSSPVEKIGKVITTGLTVNNVVLKRDTSISKPILHISTESDITGYNYMYIPQFNRYYFIDDKVSVGNNRWEILAHVDPLETFRDELLLQDVIVNKQSTKGNKYLNDGSFISQVNEFNTSYNFPNGFNTSGTFILICAGG